MDCRITLKAARVNCGMTVKEASKSLGVSERTLLHWENIDSGRLPTVAKINKICELYNVQFDDLRFC